MKTRLLLGLFLLLGCFAPLRAQQALRPFPFNGATWLASTMDETVFPAKLRLAHSLDGLHWTQTANLYSPPDGDDVRDPSIVRLNGHWYMAHTAGSYAAQGNFGVRDYFEIASSDDLVHWTHLATVSSVVAGASTFTWAPEWFVDRDGQIYVFFARSVTGGQWRIFYVRPNDDTLTTWSAPTPVGGDMASRGAIDPQVVRDGENYYLCYRNYGAAGSTDCIEIARGTTPTASTGVTADAYGSWQDLRLEFAAGGNAAVQILGADGVTVLFTETVTPGSAVPAYGMAVQCVFPTTAWRLHDAFLTP